MSDALLSAQGELMGTLVPFNPEFLLKAVIIGDGRKPVNWVAEPDHRSARQRLNQTVNNIAESV